MKEWLIGLLIPIIGVPLMMLAMAWGIYIFAEAADAFSRLPIWPPLFERVEYEEPAAEPGCANGVVVGGECITSLP